MAYSDTTVYTLDAATAALSDIIAALITHWTAAPGRWQLVSGAAPVAGEALAIVAKTSPTCHIGIRRQGTTQLASVVDPSMGITDVGDSSTAPTAGATASPDCRTGTISGVSTRLFVIEHDDAVTVVLQDSGKATTPFCLHIGRILTPLRESDAALGMDGHGALMGRPSDDFGSGITNWFYISSQTNGSRVRVFDSGGNAQWIAPTWTVSIDSSSAVYAGANADGSILSPRPILVQAIDTNGTNDCVIGLTRWLAAAPVSTGLTNQLPRVLLQSPALADEAWMYLRHTAAVTGLVVSWERGVSPT